MAPSKAVNAPRAISRRCGGWRELRPRLHASVIMAVLGGPHSLRPSDMAAVGGEGGDARDHTSGHQQAHDHEQHRVARLVAQLELAALLVFLAAAARARVVASWMVRHVSNTGSTAARRSSLTRAAGTFPAFGIRTEDFDHATSL